MPQQQTAEDQAGQNGRGDADQQDGPQGYAGDMNDRHGRHEGPQTEKRGMAEGQQPGISEEKIVTDGIERKNDDLRQHVQMVIILPKNWTEQ